MIDRSHIEKLLALNGVSGGASDVDIRTMLKKASWNDEDIEDAIAIYRRGSQVDTFMRNHRSGQMLFDDEKLKPEMVSSLLGIEMNVTTADIELRRSKHKGFGIADAVRLLTVSLIISVLVIFFAMWHFEIGPFHYTSR